MAFNEDLDVFFNVDDFAVEATYDASPVNVIFDRAYLQTLGIVAGTDPQCLAKASDIPSDAVGETIVISGTTYTIRSREPQDDGAIVLLQLAVE